MSHLIHRTENCSCSNLLGQETCTLMSLFFPFLPSFFLFSCFFCNIQYASFVGGHTQTQKQVSVQTISNQIWIRHVAPYARNIIFILGDVQLIPVLKMFNKKRGAVLKSLLTYFFFFSYEVRQRWTFDRPLSNNNNKNGRWSFQTGYCTSYSCP